MRVDESWEARVCMRLSCPGQTRTRVAWELTGYYKLEWELMRAEKREFAWDSRVLVKREQELHESGLDIIARVAKTLIKIWTSSKVHESWLSNAIEICNSHQLSPRLSEAFCLCLSLWLVPKGWYTTHPISWPSFNRPRWTCFSLLFYFNFYLYWKQ